MRNLWILLIAGTLVGCSRPSVPPQQSPITTEIIVVDALGQKYRLVSEERRINDHLTQSELWEKIEPLDTNRWYAPTLGSKLDSNKPPIFNSLSR
jgi:hypothetical protein